MRKIIISSMLFISLNAMAADDIDVTVDWVQNVARSTVLEVCGKAVSKSGKWPLIVSVVHGESTFSTMTNKEGKYCQLVGRQNYKGTINVSATSMDGQSFGHKLTSIK
jgi:hypothetical protein